MYAILQHAYRDGSLEEVVLRHLGAADGDTVIAKEIRFLFESYRASVWLLSVYSFLLCPINALTWTLWFQAVRIPYWHAYKMNSYAVGLQRKH